MVKYRTNSSLVNGFDKDFNYSIIFFFRRKPPLTLGWYLGNYERPIEQEEEEVIYIFFLRRPKGYFVAKPSVLTVIIEISNMCTVYEASDMFFSETPRKDKFKKSKTYL